MHCVRCHDDDLKYSPVRPSHSVNESVVWPLRELEHVVSVYAVESRNENFIAKKFPSLRGQLSSTNEEFSVFLPRKTWGESKTKEILILSQVTL